MKYYRDLANEIISNGEIIGRFGATDTQGRDCEIAVYEYDGLEYHLIYTSGKLINILEEVTI